MQHVARWALRMQPICGGYAALCKRVSGAMEPRRALDGRCRAGAAALHSWRGRARLCALATEASFTLSTKMSATVSTPVSSRSTAVWLSRSALTLNVRWNVHVSAVVHRSSSSLYLEQGHTRDQINKLAGTRAARAPAAQPPL